MIFLDYKVWLDVGHEIWFCHWNWFEVVQFNNLDKEESSGKWSKLANIDFRQKESDTQVSIFLIVQIKCVVKLDT